MIKKHIMSTVRGTVAITSSVILSLFAFSADAETQVVEDSAFTELTKPQSKIEAGVGGVTGSNWKFGQYNGMNTSGAFGIGNFDIRGGGAYDSNDATRWRLIGKNIGLQNREFTGEYKNQGKYKLNFGYDEIPVYRNNTYQTPYQNVGGSTLTLPSNWKYPTGNNMRTLTPGDMKDFNTVNMGTKRQRVDGGFSYFFNPQWEATASFRHEDKTGTQALGAPIVSARSVILPAPISQSTDQINAAMKYTGKQGFGQFAYYGSLFNNDINSITFQNPFAAGQPTFGRMSTAPNNQFHQFNLTGGYNFTPKTKLVANGSYARTFQNQDFIPSSTIGNGGPALPQANLNGDVATYAANIKLTHMVNKNLNFASAYKFDERENNTPVNTYNFADVDATGAATNFRSNTPYSKRTQQGNLDASYSFAKNHWLKAGYELQNIDRWCNGTWISCVDTGTTMENTGKLDYRGSFLDVITSRIGYAYSHRTADNYNQDNAVWASYPLLSNGQSSAALYNQIASTGLTAWGPGLPYAVKSASALYPVIFPNNNPNPLAPATNASAFDISGLGRFNTSARDRQKMQSNFNYQVTNKLSLGVGGDYRYDNYPNSAFGLQSSRNWGLNIDSGYAFNEDTSVQVFYSYQNIHSNTAGMSYANGSNTGSTTPGSVVGGCYNNIRAMNLNAMTDSCRNWFSNQSDNVDTVGVSFKRKGFLDGKLDINGDFVYSFARTLVAVSGGNYVLPAGGTTYYYEPAANMPTVKTQTFQFKLDAKYTINKPSAIHLSYMYQRMLSNDYVYTGTQLAGSPTGVMPTLEQAPSYSINVIGLSYIFKF